MKLIAISMAFAGTLSVLDVEASPLRYFAMGDSYTIGTGIDLSESWPAQLASRLNQSGISTRLVANLGQNTWTTQQVFEKQLPLIAEGQADFITLLIGVNDWLRGIARPTFRNRYRELLAEIRGQLSDPTKLLIITVPDFSCSPQGKKWGYGRSAINGINRLNQIIKSEAEQVSLNIVDMFPLSQQVCASPEMFARDGLHPSAKQYSLWVDLIAPVARNMLVE